MDKAWPQAVGAGPAGPLPSISIHTWPPITATCPSVVLPA